MKHFGVLVEPEAQKRMASAFNQACRNDCSTDRKHTFGLNADNDGTNALVRSPCDLIVQRGALEAHTRPQAGLQVIGIAVRMTEDLRACDKDILG